MFFVPGNFDRYSATRKTRRYKKNQESPMDNSLKSENSTEPLDNVDNISDKPQRPRTLSLVDDASQDSDAMLRVWQDKLKRRNASNETENTLTDILKSSTTISGGEIQDRLRQRNSRLPITQPAPVIAVTNTVLSPVMQESHPRDMPQVWPERAVPCRERHRSMIDPSQVREALRITNNPPNQIKQNSPIILRISSSSDNDKNQNDVDDQTSGYEDKSLSLPSSEDNQQQNNGNKKINSSSSSSSALFKSNFIPDICITTNSPTIGKTNKETELNDEGFEETQSLVSETLSQETSSGNYETDTHDSPRHSPAEMRYTKVNNSNNSNIINNKKIIGKDEIRRLKDYNNTKSGSNRNLIELKKSHLPKKSTDNLFKIDSNNKNKNEVERSGSRSSLKSSRSSLNSSTSVNTVRKLPSRSSQNLGNYTSALCAMTSNLRKGSSISLPPSSNNCNKEIDGIRKNQSSRLSSATSRIPASRSSSSGSSVGPVAKNIRKIQTVS